MRRTQNETRSSLKRISATLLLILVAGCGNAEDKAYSVPGLLGMLKDRDPDVRYTAVSNLGKYGPEAREAVPALAEALKDSHATVRMGAAYALGKIGPDGEAAVPALRKALKDRDPKVREAATFALKAIQGKK